MHPLKSPSRYGMCALFYQCIWKIVGSRYSDEVLIFLNKGELLPDINSTFNVLIPKKNKPQTMKDFRPISLCNVFYKLIFNVLNQYVEEHRIISPNQSGFVPGRVIIDNFIISFEIFHHLSSNGENLNHFALELDMSKTYDDRSEWVFLERMMHKLGFNKHCV
ncbi:LOW QUALITY PROTEIN: hypothetical protein V2J09_022554 [Rumex salicifolius]